jgi:hypothetical protein
MPIDYSKHRAAIERLYTDRCIVYRYGDAKNEVTKETKQTPQPVQINQPCRLSQRAIGQNNQTEAQNDIRYETKLFIAPEIEIRQGDMLEVTRGRDTPEGWEPIAPTRKYKAGEPFIYATHQEISIQRKEWA